MTILMKPQHHFSNSAIDRISTTLCANAFVCLNCWFKPYICERFADFATFFMRRMMNVSLKFMPKNHHIGEVKHPKSYILLKSL